MKGECTVQHLSSSSSLYYFVSQLSDCTFFVLLVMIVWRIRGKIVRNVLCCAVQQLWKMIRTQISSVLKDERWFRFGFSSCAFL